MKKNQRVSQHLQPAIVALISFLLLFVATISYTNYKKGLWEKDIRSNLLEILIGKKSKLEKALYSRIYYTRGVAAYVALNPDLTTEEFNELAREYIKNDSVISTMALSKDGIISAIYPLKGHEAALGLNLLEHPERRDIVEKTIETHQTFVAGPVELVEGGIAFISYTPIFERYNKNKNRFWGVTDIVIKLQSLFREANFTPTENGYEFALRGYNGSGDDGAVFWGNKDIFNQKPVTINIELPIGSWVLAGIPGSSWNQYANQDKALLLLLIISSLIISTLIWLFSKALVKIKQNEKELKAIFGSMDSLIVEFNKNGKYLKIAPTNDSILYKPRIELIGKTLHEVFDRERADLLLKSIWECLQTKKLVLVEYPLDINENEHWFLARISYKTEDSVILNAYDITDKKKDEELIHQSEIRLRELNGMKDKFFSIIAHDLRNPVGSMKMLTDLILEDYDTMNEKDKLELIKSMQSSSTNLHFLLEDLLEWSRSQSGKINVKKQMINVTELCDKQIQLLDSVAHLKNIRLINKTNTDAIVWADYDLIGTILRNLVSNAIKFTERGGEVLICSEEIIKSQNVFHKISVIDTGIGISKEMIDTILSVDKSVSRPGTENEKGTGLGLLLCKELIEKQGGEIFVTSSLGVGSTISFILPKCDYLVKISE